MHGPILKGRDLQAGEEVITCVHKGAGDNTDKLNQEA